MSIKQTIEKSFGGAEVAHHKNTANMPTNLLKKLPEYVTIFMSQHIGAPCTPTVKVGDSVSTGQIIGSSDSFVSAPIHSSVTGTVSEIKNLMHPNGREIEAIIIKTEDLLKQVFHEDVHPHPMNSPGELVDFVKSAGLVGLGGAGFPTSIKLSPPNKEAITSIIINGAECEPYITTDHREMLENPDELLDGIGHIQALFPEVNIYIGIEDNKSDAIELLLRKTEDRGMKNVDIICLGTKYPKGAEKVLIYECTGQIVPEGGLPSDAGAIVLNVQTVSHISKYINTGVPVINRRLTIDGDAIKNPQNLIVPIGTPIGHIIQYIGGYKEGIEEVVLLMGGPMMGNSLESDDYPTTKTTNAITVLNSSTMSEIMGQQTACINCGKCVDACPLRLLPTDFEKAVDKKNTDLLRKLNVSLCMECGSCSYACPARRPLMEKIREGKALLQKK